MDYYTKTGIKEEAEKLLVELNNPELQTLSNTTRAPELRLPESERLDLLDLAAHANNTMAVNYLLGRGLPVYYKFFNPTLQGHYNFPLVRSVIEHVLKEDDSSISKEGVLLFHIENSQTPLVDSFKDLDFILFKSHVNQLEEYFALENNPRLTFFRQHKKYEIFKYTLEHQQYLKYNGLINDKELSSYIGSLSAITKLEEEGVKIVLPYASLRNAVFEDNLDIVKYLIEQKNFDVNEGDYKYNNTSLYYAIKNQNPNMVEYLLNHGADINIKSLWVQPFSELIRNIRDCSENYIRFSENLEYTQTAEDTLNANITHKEQYLKQDLLNNIKISNLISGKTDTQNECNRDHIKTKLSLKYAEKEFLEGRKYCYTFTIPQSEPYNLDYHGCTRQDFEFWNAYIDNSQNSLYYTSGDFLLGNPNTPLEHVIINWYK